MSENSNITELLNNTFLEYFYIFGLNTETIISNDLYSFSVYEGEHEKIIPTLISKFPPFNKTQSNINENIILQNCFPNGFKLIEHVCPPKNEIFHFCLNNLKHKNMKIYFTCLLFYEQLSSYYQCKLNYEENENDLIEEETDNNIFDNENNDNLINHFPSSLQIRNNLRLNHIVSSFDKKRKSFQLSKENFFNSIYIPKIICLSSKAPFPEEKSIILKLLLKYIDDHLEVNIPIEKIIENLMLEIPFPPKGMFKFNYELNNNKIEIKQNPLNKRQILSYKMQYIFCFSISDIISIFKYILLEIPILFFSANKEKLTNIIESFISFLYPLKYQYPYISILPNLNSYLIENEECFIFGINQKYEDKILESFIILNKLIYICDIENSKCFFHTGKKNIINLKDLRQLENNLNGKESINQSNEMNVQNQHLKNINLPEHYTIKLKNRLEVLLKDNNLKININNNEYNEKISDKVSYVFFYYIVSLLNTYNSFLYNEEIQVEDICRKIKSEKINIEDVFKINDFCENVKSEEKEFYNNFFKTKIFEDFIKRKYYHDNDEEELEFLFFDEEIVKKKNKNLFSKTIKTYFSEAKGFLNEKNKDIIKYKDFSNEEKNYISNNISLLSKYFQKYNKSKSTFHYFIFPKLIYDNIFFGKKYFNQNLNYPSLEIKNMYLKKLKDELSKKDLRQLYNNSFIKQYHYYLNSKELFKNEVKDSIYLIWLRLFSMTFYYNDNLEKKIRFYEMIENIKNFSFNDEETFSIIFNCLYEYGTEYMLIQFKTFINLNYYIFNSFLTNKLENKSLTKYLTKKISISNSDNLFYYNLEENNKLFELNEEIKNKLKKRTFGNKNEEIEFDSKIFCDNCKSKFDITFISMSFDSMKKKSQLIDCPKCLKNLFPEIKVKFDNKIEKFNLFSPYYIYKFFCPKILEENGLKLNLIKLRKKYKNFFWNCIWYFTIKGLSFDMLLEYKENDIKNKDNDLNYNVDDYLYEKNNNCSSFENFHIENVINISY